MQDIIREYLVMALDVARRRWVVFCLPVALAVGIALVAVKLAPTRYEAKSLILLQSANRASGLASGGYVRQSAIEQVAAVEAWLKSDQVLRELLPRLLGPEDLDGPNAIVAQLAIMRASLKLELVGGSALEVTLAGTRPIGLGRKLEIIVSRLMEGLTGPEQSILNAAQFVSVRLKEEVEAAEATLNAAIRAAGFKDLENVKKHLRRLGELEAIASARSGEPGRAERADGELEQQADAIRRGLSVDSLTIRQLRLLLVKYDQVRARADAMVARGSGGGSNFVGIFDSPDNLLVVGRPQDPITGESSARKLAIAAIFLALIGSGGLVVAVEVLAGRVRTRSEFEAIAGVPVIARLGRLPKVMT